jgi:hypothetical protein
MAKRIKRTNHDIVVCKLPRAGLGNQLFPLMKAYTFAYINTLPVIVTGYHRVKIGPYLRREKTKRIYNGFFAFQKNILAALWDNWELRKRRKHSIMEPIVQKLGNQNESNSLYIFSAIPHWGNYFDGLKEYRHIVIELFWELISQDVRKKVEAQQAPCIGVHIRMGDFRKLKEGEDFSKVGIVRTPETYFINIINSIRKMHGTELPVSVFTDGFRNEFDMLFKLKNVILIEGNSDLADLLLLSKSKIIVTSATSTFSYWAGFLSDSILIMHPDHVNTQIRPADINNKLYQGALNPDDSLLLESIREII